MKKILLLFLAGTSLLACKQADKKTASANTADPASLTTLEWLDTRELNMGKIVEGQELEVAFRFKNTGNKALIISNVSAQCGCTIPETPKEPFAPGQEGVIKAKFNSDNRGGSTNTKEVYVVANTDPGRTVLVFKVEVQKKDMKN